MLLIFKVLTYVLQYQPRVSESYLAKNVHTAFASRFFPFYTNNTSSNFEKFKKYFSYQKLQTDFFHTYTLFSNSLLTHAGYIPINQQPPKADVHTQLSQAHGVRGEAKTLLST